MSLQVDAATQNGRGELAVVDSASLHEDIRDVSKRLATLAERFDAHAEQEEDRAKRVDDKLAELAAKVNQVPAIPTALLANLFAQTGEGQGPTGTGALAASGLVAFVTYALPRVLSWLAARRAP